jgi:hypothetical protein
VLHSAARLAVAGAAVLCLLATGPAGADAGADVREPCADSTPLRQPFFGDLHVHTAFSLDASTMDTRNRPADAYRFARGEPIGIQPYDASGVAQRSLRLARPLDFAAVTDHAELFGELDICATPGLPGHDSLVCWIYRRFPRLAFFVMNTNTSYPEHPTRFGFCGENGVHCLAAARTPWRETQEAAEGAYDRSAACRFTAFVGYEWTGGSGSRNLHRNVIFRSRAVVDLPITNYEEPTPQGLWRALRARCQDAVPGCDALAIPHNSNLSGGLMFTMSNPDGSPLGPDDARLRAAWEPLAEVMQHKGDSECRTGAGTEDELCGFEKLPYDAFQGKYVAWLAAPPGPTNFLRNALLEGLRQERLLGANPFRFGLVASTDTHLGASGFVDERAHPGHGGAGTPAAAGVPKGLPDDVEFNPGGLAGLWAEENSRESLFDAMRRREAWGTSGPRIVVRFFGGDLPGDLCASPDFAAQGYARGVPMGGVLPANLTAAPGFAVQALRDPGVPGAEGAKLQRIQIVKGFLDAGGEPREEVYEVAGDAANGAGVDPATCAPQGDGAERLCAVWRDPDFAPRAPAFWYVRVVENPTCRWHTQLCRAAAVDCARPETVTEGFEPCCDASVPTTIQERAWTSPIWWSPEVVPAAAARGGDAAP